MFPILCKVRYETLHHTLKAKSLWIQIAFSIVVNWIVAPLFMVRILVRFLLDDLLTEDSAGIGVGIPARSERAERGLDYSGNCAVHCNGRYQDYQTDTRKTC